MKYIKFKNEMDKHLNTNIELLQCVPGEFGLTQKYAFINKTIMFSGSPNHYETLSK